MIEYNIARAILTVSFTIGRKSNPCVDVGVSKIIKIKKIYR